MQTAIKIEPRVRVDPHRDLDDYEPEGDLLVLNFGPQHPSTHGVLRIKLWVDGEKVVKAVPYLGYLHRGAEKLCEKLTYVQIPPIVDKHDYVSAMTNELAVCMAFERLDGTEVPRRARYLRTIVAELQRVASHLLWFGTFCNDIGGAMGGGGSLFMYSFRERELLIDLFEELAGARMHYNYVQVGGVRRDLPAGWAGKTKAVAKEILAHLPEYHRMLDDNPVFRSRTVGVGYLDPELALELGIGGPALRASGVNHDLRVLRPYAAYDEIEVRPAVAEGGDVYARYQVRMEEMRESLRLATLLLDGIPEGPILGRRAVTMPNAVKPPKGEAYVGIEGPRGELGTYVVSDGTQHPYRVKFRAASYHALSALPYLLPGVTISDVVAILGSLDPIMGEADR